VSDSLGFVTVARVGEIPVGGLKTTRLDDTTVAVFRLDDGYWAIEDLCTHDGGPVAEGTLEGSIIECPRHGAKFDVRTGAAKAFPATSGVTTYAVRVVGDEIQVSLDPAARDAAPKNPHTGQRQPWEVPATPPEAAASAPAPGDLPPPQKPSGPPAFSSMPSQQELAVRAALETVMDPEINLSVIDLGLIREIHFLAQRTHVRMMLTTPFCPYAPQLMAEVKAATESVVPQPCEVEIMADPWSPEMMPDPGLLGFSY
jgi:nitrite reductase/ring-hydroxylating ferredoxin subunit/metal-sulfur cluster biosynthetic enzyme